MSLTADPLFVAAEVAWRKESLSGAGQYARANHRHALRRPHFRFRRHGHRPSAPRPA